MIPVSSPSFAGNEKRYLAECIDSGWVSSEGPFVTRFEAAVAAETDVAHGVAVSNGTAALETALYGLGVGQGDEVIMPSFTIISCAIAALRLGARPVLVDIDPATWCMDPAAVAARVTTRTKAVMPVHVFGHPVDLDPIFALREQYGFRILEDAAEAHGAEYLSGRDRADGGEWRRVGGLGDATATSFYANKIMTTGEGGMVLTSDETVAQRARSYRNLCFKPEQRFLHTEIGYNFRLSNLQAAVGLAQVERLTELVSRKRALHALYREALRDVPGVRFMAAEPWARSVYWMFAVELTDGRSAAEVMAALRQRGIGTRPFFLGLHAQPVLRERGWFTDESYPNTDYAHHHGFYLPSGFDLTADDIAAVAVALREVRG